MYWDVSKKENHTLIGICGAIDFEEVDDFRKLLQKRLLKQETVVIDLARCHSLCSMAVGVIVGLKIESNLSGGDLWIINACDTIRQLFDIVRGTETVFLPPPDRVQL